MTSQERIGETNTVVPHDWLMNQDTSESNSSPEVLLRAAFEPRLKKYFLLQSTFVMLISLIGIPLLPFWLLGLGPVVHRRQYEALECVLTPRSLNFHKGFLIRIQKNVPLDKITDLALVEGPLLRFLGLCSLGIETAGGGPATSTAQLIGVVDAIAFRDAVLRQRDLVSSAGTEVAPPTIPLDSMEGSSQELLSDIRDSLGRIEDLLAKQ
jgi:putative membrane protein